MKSTKNKLLTNIIFLSLLITLFTPLQIKATVLPNPPEDYGAPISVVTYESDDGAIITEKIYFYSDDESNTRSASGHGWYKNEKTIKWSGSSPDSTYYAQGYFTWGDGDVSVSSPSGGVYNVPSTITISNRSTTSGTGRYALVFNKYAYVTFEFDRIYSSLPTHESVTIRVSESGNVI